MTPSVTEEQTLTALRSFLLSFLAAGTEVVKGQDNRVPEPVGPDFVEMTPILRERLEWNIDTYSADTQTLDFAALTNTPNVGDILVNGTATASGAVVSVSGASVVVAMGVSAYFAVGDVITDQTTALAIGTVTAVAYGEKTIMQPTKFTIQLDVHGPLSGDNAQLISTLMRDAYAYDQFLTSGFDVSPLYASEPRQLPFANAEQQIEYRYVVDTVLQCNPVISVSAQYAAALVANVIDVDATYPA